MNIAKLFGSLTIGALLVGSIQAGTITVGVIDDQSDIVNTGGVLINSANFGGTGAVVVNGIPHPNSNSTYTPVNFTTPYMFTTYVVHVSRLPSFSQAKSGEKVILWSVAALSSAVFNNLFCTAAALALWSASTVQ